MAEKVFSEIATALAMSAVNNLVSGLFPNKPIDTAKTIFIEKKRIELNGMVEKARDVIDNGEGLNSQYLGNLLDLLIKGEEFGDVIDYVFQNKLNMDREQELDTLLEELKDLIHKQSDNQSRGHENEKRIPPSNVRRCLFYLSCFPKDFVFNLKRITRFSVPHEFIPSDLNQVSDFLKLADSSWDMNGAPNHFQLKDNVRQGIKDYPEKHYSSRIAVFPSKEINPNKLSYLFFIVLVGTDHNLDFTQRNFMHLRILSLRNVSLTKNINVKNLSSLQYLDLKHTNVRDCSWLEGLENLQMLDLRYTYVEEIPEKCLEKLGKLQHLLLGYIPKEGENQLAGTELNLKKLKTTNLKTLRAIRLPEVTQEISCLSNVSDLSVTGLTVERLQTFWKTLEKFENLTSLGVAMTHQSVIKLEHCGVKLKNNLKRLRMEGLHSRLEKLGEFGNLIDLTLASHIHMDIENIPGLRNLKLLCLRLYGVCQETTCKIGLQGFDRLKKLVIGDMGKVETVQIGCAVIETVATLKFSNLPLLKEVVYTEKQHSNKQHSLLRWGNGTKKVRSEEVQLDKTIFLRHFDDFPVNNSPGLKIYSYDMEKQCYELLNATQNNQVNTEDDNVQSPPLSPPCDQPSQGARGCGLRDPNDLSQNNVLTTLATPSGSTIREHVSSMMTGKRKRKSTSDHLPHLDDDDE